MESSKTQYASADNTRRLILKAARHVFIKEGFAGASIQAIAKKAAINHSLIFHHFGNKQKLWLAVKAMIVEEANKKKSTIPNLNQPFNAFLEALTHNTIDFYEKNPDIIRLINWQRLTTAQKKNTPIGITPSKEMSQWINAFQHYQETGDITQAVPAEFMVTLLLSLISSFVIDNNTFIQSDAQKNKYIQLIISTLLARFTPSS